MTLQKIGGLAALTCAATYLFGVAILLTLLAPFNYGRAQIDVQAVVELISARPGLLIFWNTTIYILNGLALTVLVAALHGFQRRAAPNWATVTCALGLIWATLVLAAGMIGNVAVERTALLAPNDLERAVMLWEMLHAVELGLGGGNEILGGLWIAGVSIAGGLAHRFEKLTIGLGLLSGAGGVLTLIPALGDNVDMLFGLTAIAWFLAVGATLLCKPADT